MAAVRARKLHGLIALTASLLASPASAVALPPAEILHQLQSFNTTGTVLHLAAHPDDENTQLITYLARGRGYRAAYLSLTRGDGGQNELGRDFGEKLGVARTQELIAARQLDGGRQFFTRAIDFGFSKTPEETLRFWDRAAVLADVVRVIRQFRPDVIVTRFPVPPGSGGHGHHTASAILAVEAFKLAGDPKAYPEQLAQGLTPWQPKRVFWNGFTGRSGGTLTGPTITVDIGGNDPVTAEPFGTIANRSRGMHKTQGLGVFSNRTASGVNEQTFLLLAGEPATKDLMDGIDVTWNRVPGGAEISALTTAAIAQFKSDDPAASVPALLALRARLAALPTDPLVTDKRTQLDTILQACLGLSVETTTARIEVVPGESLQLNTRINLTAAKVPVRLIGVQTATLDTEKSVAFAPVALVAGQPYAGVLTRLLPLHTALTQPYWLREDGAEGVFRVDDPALIGRPENPPAVPLAYVFEVGGQQLVIADQPRLAAGIAAATEVPRPLAVIPPVSLAFNSEVFLFAPGSAHPVTVEISAARVDTEGTVRLKAPAGWKISPATQPFKLARVGDQARFTFTVTAPASESSGWIGAEAEVGGQTYANQRQEIRYAHLPLQLLQPPARARLAGFTLATKGRTIGYLPGAGDYLAECLEQMGYTVRMLTGADLTAQKLHDLDAVVIGVRAFNERSDLAANFPGLLAYVENGGTVVAQYNRPNNLTATVLGPYALSIQGPAPQLRVTDETSPVTFLLPEHAALTKPNHLSAADFNGWTQERGAYFPSSWDESHYVAILAMNDPGEAPLNSSVLIARHGKGHYVYTGLGFFRQLPAGVPGAYRLFANLLALGQ